VLPIGRALTVFALMIALMMLTGIRWFCRGRSASPWNGFLVHGGRRFFFFAESSGLDEALHGTKGFEI